MFYIKRRIIEIELLNITTAPYIQTLSNKKVVVYFRALVRISDFRAFIDNTIFLVDMIAPPYTISLWSGIWRRFKKERKEGININFDFIKLYGYPFKPSEKKIGFYIVDATERKKIKTNSTFNNSDTYAQYFFNTNNSYYEGEDYLKEKYPTLKEHNEKDYIKPLLYKLSTSNRIFYYSLSASITLYQFLDLSPITNPNHKEELKDKPLFYQLVDTLADMIIKELNISKPLAIKEVMKSSNYKAQKPKD